MQFIRPSTTRKLARSFSDKAVILSAARTPVGSFQGALSSFTGPQLGAIAVKDAMTKSGVAGEDVDEVYLGNVCSAGVGQAPARQAAIHGGLPWSVPCTTVNKVCSSGMKSIYLGAQTVMAGTNNVIVSGGFESMSNIPFYLPKGRTGYGYGHGQVLDGVVKDGLWDAFDDQHMGSCAEKCAEHYGFTREQQDAFALESYRRANAATEAGLFKAEIAPVEIKQRKGDPKMVSVDEEPGKLRPDKVAGLRPAFKKDGTVTAANASSLNDGGAALVVAGESWSADRSLTPMARIIGFGDAAHEPIWFTTAPSLAIPVALARAGITAADVDLWELNEAFSVVGLVNNQLLGLDPAKVNVNGGAVGIGHPIGASGARIVITLLHALIQQDKTIGVAGICNGGGGASAIVVERLK